MTLVGRCDGRVQIGVRKNLEGADEDIAGYGDGSVILCTDEYTIYRGIDDYKLSRSEFIKPRRDWLLEGEIDQGGRT
mgnify:CR=1 FL=1